MNRFLLTWEYGDALGHLARLRPVALKLAKLGHEVTMALRPSAHAAELPAELRVVPAPPGQVARECIRQPVSMADILYNQATSDPRMLAGQVRAWHGLFELVKPDVVVMDHSPIALLSLQGQPWKKVLLGTGFACPPAISPLPDLRAWQNHYPDRIKATEQAVLEALNTQLENQQQPTLDCVGRLFERVDDNLLTTFPELDHYPNRSSGEYLGTWSDLAGAKPVWPDGDGPRIFAYLKPHRGLVAILDHLASLPVRTLVYIGGTFNNRRWKGCRINFSDHPLNMTEVGRECDLAILHAGHGATASLMLAGKPILQIPIHVEQYHNALRTEQQGAGCKIPLGDSDGFRAALAEMLGNPKYHEAARDFANQHADHDPQGSVAALVDRLLKLANH